MSTPLVDVQARRTRSLKILQTIQRNAEDIIEDATFVALYRFLEDSQKWIRMDIEGSAFITRNSSKPRYSFVILNKIGDQDLVLQVEEDILKAKVQDKYVMMQCLHSDGRVIFGLWFHDSNERQRTFDAMQSILSNKTSGSSLRKLDIATILSPTKSSAAGPEATEQPAKALSDQSMANALTKSSQLLALLKHSSSATTAPASMDVTTVSVPKPEESSEESATSRLKAALSLSQRPNVVAPPAAPAVALPVTAVSDSTDKSKMLLSLVRGRAEGSQSRAAATKDSSSSDAVQTPVKPPSRAVEASTGAELLTDGDIAKMMNALIAKPQPATRSPQQPSPVVPSPSASAATSSATLIAPSSLFAEEVSVPPSAMKPIKKSSIKLISPSDLEAF